MYDDDYNYNNLERAERIFNECLKDNKELQHQLLMRGLSEEDRKTFEELKLKRIEFLESKRNKDNSEEDKED